MLEQPPHDPPRFFLLSAEIMGQLGGGFRQQRWCEFFLERGQSVRIFCLAGATRVQEAVAGDVATLRRLRSAWTSRAESRAGVRTGAFARIARRIKQALLAELFYPSLWRLAVRLIRTVAGSEGPVVLLCSSPPFSLAVVSAIVKSGFGPRVVFVLDMRDLWSLHSALPGPRTHRRAIEGWALRRADLITTVSVGLAERFERAFGVRASVVYNVATHVEAQRRPEPFDWTVWSPTLRPHSRKIVYTGSLPEGFYDLDALIEACALFSRAQPDAADRLQLVFVGAGAELKERAAGKVAAELMVFPGQVTHAQAAAFQQAADTLLFLGYRSSDNQGQVSIKLFEYFRRRQPILPLSIKAGSDVDHLVRLYCGFCPLLNSAEDIANALAMVARGELSALPLATNDTADAELLQAYAQTVEKVLRLYERAANPQRRELEAAKSGP